MCTDCSKKTKYNTANKSLSGSRYSNITTSKAEQECLEEMSTSPTAYGGNFSKCVESKKQASTDKVIGVIGNAGTWLNSFKGAVKVFTGPDADPLLPPPSSSGNEGLSPLAWGGIILGALVLGSLMYMGIKKATA